MYQDEHKYNVIKGLIPDFGYDVKFAIKVDGEKQNKIPESQAKGDNGKFYKVEVNCDNNVDGEWDYNAWNVKLDGVVENSKCTLSFVSNMDATERDNILKEGVSYRRNTYRGKDITNYWNGKEKVNNRDLYEQISNCTFDDIYVGDYIIGNNNVTWLIADLNNYLYSGDVNNGLTKCHATIIPAGSLGNGRMNSEQTTKGGYANSEMVTSKDKVVVENKEYDTLNTVFEKYIKPDFTTHVINYRNLLTVSVYDTSSNQHGSNTGASSSWDWYDRYLDLMGEVNVYGSTVASSSIYDIGIDNRQYAIFKLMPELINSDGAGNRYRYWLKAVSNSTNFTMVSAYGSSSNFESGSLAGIRPRFLID